MLGWDFKWLGDRISVVPLPWSFERIVSRHARRSPDLLDMDTGGGEWLAALADRPRRTVATESWPPNVRVAGERPRPRGVVLVWSEDAPDNVDQLQDEHRGRLPFATGSFSLISNRHPSFLATEIERVLALGGTFLTQQVGGDYDDFYRALELVPPGGRGRFWNLRRATTQIEVAGLRVTDSGEGAEVTSFADAGALAWYLKAIPWAVEGFSIRTHRPGLERIQARILAEGPIALAQPAFWLKAVKSPDSSR